MRTKPNQRRVMVVSEPGKAGVKRHVVDLLRNIDLTDLDVTFVYSLTRSDTTYPSEIEEFRARGIRCIEIPMESKMRVPADIVATCRLWWEMLRRRPQVLHLHSSKAGGLGRAASVGVFPRPRVLYTPNAMSCFRSRLFHRLERLLAPLTTRLIAVSDSERKDFIKWKIRGGEEAHVLTCGVAKPLIEPRKERDESDGRPWRIGACGRISYQKNALLFFRTALELLKQHPSWQFIWIGDFDSDDEAKAVHQLLEEAKWPPQIEITGWVSDAEERIRDLDTFCMSSRYESFGYVTAEALLLKVPVVAIRATGTVDLIIDGQTGLLSDETVESFAAALTRIHDDRELRERMCEQGMRYVADRLTIERMVDEIRQLYLDDGRQKAAPAKSAG